MTREELNEQLKVLITIREESLKLISSMDVSLVIKDKKDADLFRTFSNHEAASSEINFFDVKENLTPQTVLFLEYFKQILEYRSIIDRF